LLGTLRLTPHLEARINPHLIFASRSINYSLKYPQTGDSVLQQKSIESIYTSFPLQLKFSSDRINNFRVYIIGGGKFEYDLASNSQPGLDFIFISPVLFSALRSRSVTHLGMCTAVIKI
jgi:hypothetical protein